MGLEVLAGQLVERHDAEHGRLPHRGLHVVVRLQEEEVIVSDVKKVIDWLS